MYLHPRVFETQTLLGLRCYALEAIFVLTPIEREAICRHAICDRDVFVDPARARYRDAAEAASIDARGFPLMTPAGAFGMLGAELRALYFTVVGGRAFHLRVGDLVDGVTIIHRQYADIRAVERALVAAVDDIDVELRAALRYARGAEAIIEPRTTNPPMVRPSRWFR